MPRDNIRHVFADHGRGGWTVRKPMNFRVSARCATREEAEARAKEIVSNLGGGTVTVQDWDGSRWEFVQSLDGSWRDSREGPIEADVAIPPGELLAEELDARGMTQRELAAAMGRPPATISAIVRGRKALTPQTAIEIERVLRIPATIWVGLEAQYRLALARQEVA
ncbi:MAG: HigA family addiction module antidote protein [Chloroflexi bacterium]|nr:HigA family addiction module antidote protein [Chloroflexota bacterium]